MTKKTKLFPIQCPKCKTPMEYRIYRIDYGIDECPKCHTTKGSTD